MKRAKKEKSFTPLEDREQKKDNKTCYPLTGFTLVEIMVSIAIFLILLSIVVLNYRQGKQQLALNRVAYKVAQDIRKTEEMAVAAQKYDCGGGIFVYSYGISFKQNPPGQNQYVIIADCNQNQQCNEGVGNLDKTIETINFETGIQIKSLSTNNLCIIFTPPDPTVYIGPGGNPDVASITLEIIGNPIQTKNITINKAGLIDVQ